MKKLCFTSLLAMMVAPAVAAPTHTSSTFPSNGFMEEDYTYQNQANVTNLKVSSGTATTTANYANCPTEFPNSDEGAESTDECYTACTVSDFPAGSHIASVTGKNYSGANVTDTCAIASCDTGYTLNPGAPNLTEIIGVPGTAAAYGYVDHSGTYTNGKGTTSQATYGISAPDTWGVNYYGSKGRITGKALCSTQVGYTNTVGNNNNVVNNPTTSDNVTADFTNGQYCWCQLDSYTSSSGVSQSLSSTWVFNYDMSNVNSCANYCARNCAGVMRSANVDASAYRAAVFGSLDTETSCKANTIAITWADASAEDIAANDAGSVTYGGDIRTPKKAVHKPGKIFTGWTFNAQ